MSARRYAVVGSGGRFWLIQRLTADEPADKPASVIAFDGVEEMAEAARLMAEVAADLLSPPTP